jgi:RimJ/RimL family protein N-acetyltransferase
VPVVRGLPLAQFAVAGDDRLNAEYLADQRGFGCMPDDWRFAFVGADGAIGTRITYWSPPGATVPMLIDAIAADAAGTLPEVLAASLDAVGLDTIDFFADRESPAAVAAGFTVISTQVRLAHTGPVVPTAVPPGVALRSVAELGYDVLPELIRATQIDSGDRGSRTADPVAELAALRELEHDPSWWELAVDRETGAPLGFVAPVRTGDGGHVIALIGVAATARGRGLGRCLLAAGTATLRRDAPTARIIADVDETNPAMLRTAAAIGYQPFATRTHYRYVRATPT